MEKEPGDKHNFEYSEKWVENEGMWTAKKTCTICKYEIHTQVNGCMMDKNKKHNWEKGTFMVGSLKFNTEECKNCRTYMQALADNMNIV